MGARINHSSDTKWEAEFSYSRGVRVGESIFISGTTSVRNGEIVGEGDIKTQAVECFRIIEETIKKLGGTLADVVRTRMYVTDITQSEAVGKAHSLFFKGIDPAATMVEVSRLINEGLLVEIEADAIIQGRT